MKNALFSASSPAAIQSANISRCAAAMPEGSL